jgi:predicted nucleotidyltransferase
MTVTRKAMNIDRIVSLAKRYGATRLILFGSAATGPSEARDIDLACDGIPGWKLFEFAARLENELEVSFDVVPLTPRDVLRKTVKSCYDRRPIAGRDRR